MSVWRCGYLDTYPNNVYYTPIKSQFRNKIAGGPISVCGGGGVFPPSQRNSPHIISRESQEYTWGEGSSGYIVFIAAIYAMKNDYYYHTVLWICFDGILLICLVRVWHILRMYTKGKNVLIHFFNMVFSLFGKCECLLHDVHHKEIYEVYYWYWYWEFLRTRHYYLKWWSWTMLGNKDVDTRGRVVHSSNNEAGIK